MPDILGKHRVVLVAPVVGHVGVTTHVKSLALGLQRMNILVGVVCPGEGWLSRELRSRGVPVETMNMSPQLGKAARMMVGSLRYAHRLPRGTIIHVHGRLCLLAQLLVLILMPYVPIVVTVHALLPREHHGRAGLLNALERWCLRRADAVICVSHAVENDYRSLCKPDQHQAVCTVLNWLDENPQVAANGRADSILTCSYRESKDIDSCRQHKFRVCFVGRLAAEKGPDVLIDAVSLVAQRGRSVSCTLFGAGPLRPSLERRVQELELSSVVAFMGQDDEGPARMSEYDCVVVPSRSEAFGLVLLEAFDAGVPAIASRLPGITEVVGDECAILVAPGDACELADAVEFLMDRPDESTRHVALARERLARGFRLDKGRMRSMRLCYLLACSHSAGLRVDNSADSVC
ncbi:glycosyltransferase family 4 protein [Candidatus Cryosericum odellii]|jgi:glycosyltransferase involved in cell wall biosynthesis|uniref:Glycosyltransferase family 1 protein n=1 Tax=Candidatus Cryosericum odellii TaxID=2290917 RepID=A0A398D7F9_9BACT|nr:glycosyltransferase family 1 protein [Candidatus Cryosericum odellii]RIE08037.1 glycosyltransferase family 1 protein [Candidatus Cryosericum odellii]